MENLFENKKEYYEYVWKISENKLPFQK
jgi:hypothetical protein